MLDSIPNVGIDFKEITQSNYYYLNINFKIKKYE